MFVVREQEATRDTNTAPTGQRHRGNAMTTTMTTAADAYLAKISTGHTPSTNATYRRNFDRVITPYFGKDTPLARITTDQVTAFLASDALLRKPTGEPRAVPTLDQITGLFRAFLHDASTTGLVQEGLLPEGTFPRRRRERRHQPRLCENCKAIIDEKKAIPHASTTQAAEPPVTAPEPEQSSTQPLAEATKSAEPGTTKPQAKRTPPLKAAKKTAAKAGPKIGKARVAVKPAKGKAAK